MNQAIYDLSLQYLRSEKTKRLSVSAKITPTSTIISPIYFQRIGLQSIIVMLVSRLFSPWSWISNSPLSNISKNLWFALPNYCLALCFSEIQNCSSDYFSILMPSHLQGGAPGGSRGGWWRRLGRGGGVCPPGTAPVSHWSRWAGSPPSAQSPTRSQRGSGWG